MKLKALLIFAYFLMSVSVAISSDYYTLEEYYKKHPEQIDITTAFNSRVKHGGEPIKDTVQKSPVRVAYVYPGKQSSDYWQRSITSFTERMDEINIKYEIEEYVSEVNVELRDLEALLQEALEKDPDYLVFTFNILQHRKIIERILIQGRPKLILQNITTPLKDWEGIQPFLYVGFDHALGTKDFLAKHLLQLTNGEGDYAILYFTEGYVSIMRGDTFIQHITENSKHRLVASYYTDGQREKAKLATLEIINNNSVKFIYACSTDIALGALDALRELGKVDEVIVNGWGGGSNELLAIQQGELNYTVMRMNDDNGVAMAEAIRLDIEKNSSKIPAVFSGDFAIVEKGIQAQDLQNLRQRAFRYSGVQ